MKTCKRCGYKGNNFCKGFLICNGCVEKENKKTDGYKVPEYIPLDIEPKWVNLVPLLVEMKNKETAKAEIMKMAVIADKVRQAQKNKEKLVFDFREVKK